ITDLTANLANQLCFAQTVLLFLFIEDRGEGVVGVFDVAATGSGLCTGTSGLPFDNSLVKIGNILATEATKVINNQVTWRLCSGGTSLPIGNVTSSAEMLVTFN
ncbi:hypothetical protein ACMU9X_003418, partial [Yersinia enterocolitica]